MKVRWKGKTKSLVLTHNKVYEVIGIEKDWYRIVDDSGEDYLYAPDDFVIVEEWDNSSHISYSTNDYVVLWV